MSDKTSKLDNTKGDDVALGQRLRDAREYLGLSQEFVSEQLKIPRASISAMETGKRKVSSLELKQLARLYKQPIASLLGEGEEAALQPDESTRALFRTARSLSEEDKAQLLRFAQFLRQAGKAPTAAADEGESRDSADQD